MTIPAESLRVVIRLVRVTAITNFSFLHGPLMWNMTKRAVRRRVCSLQMKTPTIRMTTRAVRLRLELRFLQMAACTRKSGHRSIRRVRVARRAFRCQTSAAPVALIAAEICMFTEQ